MKCLKFTVTSAEINALSLNGSIVKNVYITVDSKKVTPRAVKYVNSSGADLGISLISNDNEYADITVNPTWYIPMPLDSGKSEQNLATHTQKIIITKIGNTSATGDLVFYCNNYYEIG